MRPLAGTLRLLASAALLLALLALAPSAGAHELRSAFLELRELGDEVWAVRLRVPMQGDLRLRLSVQMPAGCSESGPHQESVEAAMHTDAFRVCCAGGLAGRNVTVAGLSQTVTDVLVRIERASGATQTTRLLPDAPVLAVQREPGTFDVGRTYLGLGISHILLGWDHLAFVLALLLLVSSRKKLIFCVTAFTLAHSVTLAAATLGVVFVPQKPVEATIALSVAFLAAELVRARKGAATLTSEAPWLVAFGFGLLHGLGFAGALAEVGLPETALPAALFFFNLGVECGQLAFVCGVLALIALGRGLWARHSARAVLASAYAVGGLAAYWTIERVISLVN